MPEAQAVHSESVTVGEFARASETGLRFEVVYGGDALSNQICSPRVQKLGLALAGFTDYIHPERVQLLGGSELNYLSMLAPEDYHRALDGVRRLRISCIVITKGLEVPAGFVDLAQEAHFVLLRTSELSSLAFARITGYLEMRLAQRSTIHGVFMEIFGLGVLILGPSGIGKSECALDLVLRGHRLIADDSVEITRLGIDRLVGAGGPILKHHMELRGLGIIDLKELFGISAVGNSHDLDFVVRLERWKPQGEYDRLGLDRPSIEIMGVPVALIEMPVAPGRNISTLVEVAARTHLLRKRGGGLSRELEGGGVPEAGKGASDGT